MESLLSFQEALSGMPTPTPVELKDLADTEPTDVEAVSLGIGALAVEQKVLF